MTFKDTKDPQSVEDYTINWAATMAETSPADTIITSSWVADNGVVIDSDTNTTDTATVWVSGGTLLRHARVVNSIVTAAGRKRDRTITLKIQNK